MKFYSVEIDQPGYISFYFKSAEKALDYLWHTFMFEKGKQLSESEIDGYKYFLEHCWSIPSYGTVWECEFEDEDDE